MWHCVVMGFKMFLLFGAFLPAKYRSTASINQTDYGNLTAKAFQLFKYRSIFKQKRPWLHNEDTAIQDKAKHTSNPISS